MSPTEPPPSSLDDQTLEDAAAWLLRARREGGWGGSETATGEDPGRLRADDAVARAWDAVGEVGSTPEMIGLRRAALKNASRAAKARWRQPLLPKVSSRWIGVAAVLLITLASAAIYVWSLAPRTQVYETPVGERRVVTLADNSKVTLDQDSRVSVRYSRRFRDLHLLKGQAEFDVAKDHLRPFTVSVGGRRVVATGTLFNVDLLDSHLFVTLLRGGVVVAREGAVAEEIPLRPLDRLIVERATGSVQKTRVDAADVEAWELGKLVFGGEPLDQALARVNRYAPRKITLAASSQARQPISGVFNVGDVDAFADAVSAQLPLRAEPRGNTVALVPR